MKRITSLLLVCVTLMLAVCAAGCIALNDTPTTPEELDEQLKNTPISYAEVNGATLAYREFGDPNNDPLVLIIGYTGFMDDWSGQFVNSLAEEYHVYIYDHRGVGYSKDDGKEYQLEQLADDCVGLMTALGHETFHIAGHSMGSMISQILLVKYPENIEKAVLISTSPTPSYPGAALTPDLIEASVTRENEMNGMLREGLALLGYKGVALENVEDDVLVIVGTEDTVTLPEACLEVVEQIDGSWFIRIKGSTHFVWLEAPLRVAECMKLFLGMDIIYTP